MSQIPLADLTERVHTLLAQSPLHEFVRNVAVELSEYDDDTVRVIIRLTKLEAIGPHEAIKVVRRIEDELAEVDDRFASVRFAEAA